MLKISTVDTGTERRLILEGRLVSPWIEELRTAWTREKAELNDRELVIDVENVTVISQDGEDALLRLINEGAQFRCRSVLTRHVLQQLARRGKRNTTEIVDTAQPNMGEQKGKK
jgi:hypothetical protein